MGKKYDYRIEQNDDTFTAKIIRQVNSRKVHVSKRQAGFANEAEAKTWAEKELVQFTKTLSKSNERHTQDRKSDEEIRSLRSARRSEKTLQAKEAKLALDATNDRTADDADSSTMGDDDYFTLDTIDDSEIQVDDSEIQVDDSDSTSG